MSNNPAVTFLVMATPLAHGATNLQRADRDRSCNRYAFARKKAGISFVMAPSMAAFTAAALRLSGTERMIFPDFAICCTLIVIARRGTSSGVENQPSDHCCRRHASFNCTRM